MSFRELTKCANQVKGCVVQTAEVLLICRSGGGQLMFGQSRVASNPFRKLGSARTTVVSKSTLELPHICNKAIEMLSSQNYTFLVTLFLSCLPSRVRLWR